MKCIGTLLKTQSSFMSFMKEGGMELLMEIAVKPQPALGYAELDSPSSSSEDRDSIAKTLWDIAEQTQDPVSFFHNPTLVHDFLPHFPFKVSCISNKEIRKRNILKRMKYCLILWLHTIINHSGQMQWMIHISYILRMPLSFSLI